MYATQPSAMQLWMTIVTEAEAAEHPIIVVEAMKRGD